MTIYYKKGFIFICGIFFLERSLQEFFIHQSLLDLPFSKKSVSTIVNIFRELLWVYIRCQNPKFQS